MAYIVDTQAGYNGLNQLYAGSGSFSASDGSVWRLGSDGNPYATMKNGAVLPIEKALDDVTYYAAHAAAQSAGSNNLSASTYDRYLKELKAAAGENTQQSIKLAQMQNEWQELQNAKAMAFNEKEASVNRQWQEYMSNTAHQREIKDLVAAGLNPVLSVTGGQGASVGSGAQASGVTSSGARGEVDRSFSSALGNMLGTLINSATQITQSNINAQTQRDVERMKEQHAQYMAENYPSNVVEAIAAAFGALQSGSAYSKIGNVFNSWYELLERFGLAPDLLDSEKPRVKRGASSGDGLGYSGGKGGS